MLSCTALTLGARIICSCWATCCSTCDDGCTSPPPLVPPPPGVSPLVLPPPPLVLEGGGREPSWVTLSASRSESVRHFGSGVGSSDCMQEGLAAAAVVVGAAPLRSGAIRCGGRWARVSQGRDPGGGGADVPPTRGAACCCCCCAGSCSACALWNGEQDCSDQEPSAAPMRRLSPPLFLPLEGEPNGGGPEAPLLVTEVRGLLGGRPGGGSEAGTCLACSTLRVPCGNPELPCQSLTICVVTFIEVVLILDHSGTLSYTEGIHGTQRARSVTGYHSHPCGHGGRGIQIQQVI